MESAIVLAVLIVLLLVLLYSGLEIAFGVGLVGFIGILVLKGSEVAMDVLGFLPWAISSSYILITIPLFILMSALIQQSGISQSLYTAGTSWFGRLPGGLALGSMVACAVNSVASTSSQDNAVAIGAVAIADIEQHGHSNRFNIGALAAGGILSLLILPSTAIIIYGVLTEQSIGVLFFAGLIPGLILSTLFAAYILIAGCFRPHLTPRLGAPSGKQLLIGLVNMLLPVILGIIILGGIFTGIMTPTEAAATAVLVAFFLALIWALVRGRPVLSVLGRALRQTVQTTCMIMLVLVACLIFLRFLALSGITGAFTEFIISMQMSPVVVLGLICLGYIIIGCFMEPLILMVISLPLLFPVVVGLGYDPIWFGVILMILIGIGMVLPPVGRNLRIVQSIGQGYPIKEIFIGATPFGALMVILLGLLVAFPLLALWLPGLMMR